MDGRIRRFDPVWFLLSRTELPAGGSVVRSGQRAAQPTAQQQRPAAEARLRPPSVRFAPTPTECVLITGKVFRRTGRRPPRNISWLEFKNP